MHGSNSKNPTAQKRAFLAAYAKSASITKAAEITQIDRATHYERKASDPDYAAEFERTKVLACETLEDEAIRRAHEGVRKPVYQGGKPVGYVQEYSDTLLIFLLKAACLTSTKNGVTERTGPKGEPLFDFSRCSTDRLAALAGELRAAKNRGGT